MPNTDSSWPWRSAAWRFPAAASRESAPEFLPQTVGLVLHQAEIARCDLREHGGALRGRQTPQGAEQAAEHRSIVVQHRKIPILQEARALDGSLLAGHGSPLYGPAEHPIHRAMTVVRAAIAVLAERAPELREHDDDGIAPLGAERLREDLQAAAETCQVPGERPLRCAFAHVRIPAADIDEAQPIFVAHQMRHALGLELEALGVDGTAVGCRHFLGDLLGHFLAKIQSVAHRGLEMMVGIHVAQNAGLTPIERRLADILER